MSMMARRSHRQPPVLHAVITPRPAPELTSSLRRAPGQQFVSRNPQHGIPQLGGSKALSNAAATHVLEADLLALSTSVRLQTLPDDGVPYRYSLAPSAAAAPRADQSRRCRTPEVAQEMAALQSEIAAQEVAAQEVAAQEMAALQSEIASMHVEEEASAPSPPPSPRRMRHSPSPNSKRRAAAASQCLSPPFVLTPGDHLDEAAPSLHIAAVGLTSDADDAIDYFRVP